MIKTIAVVSVSAFAIAATVKFPGLHPAPPTGVADDRQVAVQLPATQPREAARPASHREQMARLVAETAATTADRTAHRVLAERSGVQQTALR